MGEQIKLLGIAGSLRKESYNKAALQAARELVPSDTVLEIFDLEGIPPYNQDNEHTPPPRVVELKAKVREADGILFATPEYNYSISGVLKNAIDWASRPYVENAWNGKPAAVMSASIGRFGGARAQYHLRQIFVFVNIFAVNQPEVMITADQVFDEHLRVTNETTKKLMAELLQNLVDLSKRLSGKSG